MRFLIQILSVIVLTSLIEGHLFAKESFFDEAGKKFQIDPKILLSIAKVESNLNPKAINYNQNGTLDIGIMQINSIHLPLLLKFGIKQNDLFNPRINIHFGAYVLAKCLDKHGMTLNGLNCYNGRLTNNPYAMKVLKQFVQMEHK